MPKSKDTFLLVAAAGGLTVAVIALAAYGRLVFVGSGDWLNFVTGEWADLWYPFAYFAVFLALVLALIRASDKLGRAAMAAVVALLALFAFALHLATGFVTPSGAMEFVPALGVRRTNVFYDNARRIRTLDDYLCVYEDRVRISRDTAARTHPPGPEMFYFSLQTLYRACPALRHAVFQAWDQLSSSRADLESAEMRTFLAGHGLAGVEARVAFCVALTVKLLACLVVVPVYLLGAGLSSRRTGLIAAAFAALLPSVHCFSPGLDQVYPLIAATLGWLALVAARKHNAAAAALFGLLLCGALLFSLAFLVAAGVIGLVVLAGLVRGRRGVRTKDLLRAHSLSLLCAGLGFVLLVVMFGMLWGLNLFAVWARCSRANAAFNATTGRSYAMSLVSNPVEYLVFLGLPLACMFVASLRRSARVLQGAWPPAMAIFCFVAVMVVVNLAGVNRGEVARLWMFTMPLCAIAGAWWIEARRSPTWVLCALLTLQFAQVACFRVTVDALSLYAS